MTNKGKQWFGQEPAMTFSKTWSNVFIKYLLFGFGRFYRTPCAFTCKINFGIDFYILITRIDKGANKKDRLVSKFPNFLRYTKS